MANHDSENSRSEVMYPATTANGATSQAMVPAAPMAMPGAMPGSQVPGGFLPRGPEILTGAFNQTWLLNCLRRKWLPALLLGMLAAGLSALALLVLFPESSTVTAYLELKPEQSETFFGKAKSRAFSAKEFEIFQQSQQALFRSQFVLKAALAKQSIAELDAVYKEGENALTWLTEELRVSFQGEILEIRFSGEESSADMVKVVNSVIDAYRNEVLAEKSMLVEATREVLRDLRNKTSKELQEKIDQHQTLAKAMGGGGNTPLSSTMLGMLRNEMLQIQSQINKAKDQLLEYEVMKTVAIQQAKSPSAMRNAVEIELEQDPMMLNFRDEKYAMAQQLRQMQANSRGGRSKQIDSMQARYQRLEQDERKYKQIAERDIRDRLKGLPNESLSGVMAEYVMRREGLNKNLAELHKAHEEKMEEMLLQGETSGSVALLQSDIEQLREVLTELDFRLRAEDVDEETALDRVRVIQPALAQERMNKVQRLLIAAFGGVAAFCLTCYGVALLDFRRRRLNGAADIDEGLGIRVLGVLPSVSSRKAMAPGSSVAAQLSESIDNVRATLMHDSTSKARQVVLVTSPASMEGCTTVASHLALSLSRAGRRTLLIDGDLREPALHKLFGMPSEDGLSELLRSEIEVSDALRPTNTEGLWLITAGQCDMDAIHALAADQLEPIFKKLRAEFDFIIIDGAPVLSLSDSLSIGQHVDGAILTVLRDHSEIRSIYQAAELLKSMGIRVIGSVVNGVATKADRRVARLHAVKPQPKRKLAAVEES